MKNKATRNNMRGFSLMEMLVTVLILVILFALAMIPISKIQKNLRQTELDSRAEMIFSAVQNRMTRLQAAGQDSYYQPADEAGAAKLMNMIPKDADEANYKKTTLAYVTARRSRILPLPGSIRRRRPRRTCGTAAGWWSSILPAAAFTRCFSAGRP